MRKNSVAGGMAVVVVDALEVVDVQQTEAERLRRFLGAHKLALQAFVEMTMVAEPREQVRQPRRIARNARCVEHWYSEIAISGPTERRREDRGPLPEHHGINAADAISAKGTIVPRMFVCAIAMNDRRVCTETTSVISSRLTQ